MFAKRLMKKATHHHHRHNLLHNVYGSVTPAELDFQIAVHYGIPSTASVFAFDPVQRLLAIGTLDGRIKVIGGDNIEGLLISLKQLPYKYLEFLSNQGYLVSITNDNDIEVWDLDNRRLACSLQWESNITAFAVIYGSCFMYLGDEYGVLSVLKSEAEDGKLVLLPYQISANSLTEAAGSSLPNHQTIVGVLPQPCSSGNRVLIAYESGLIILWDVVDARVVIVRGDKVLDLKNTVVDSPSEGNALPNDTDGLHLEEKEISALCWASSNGSIVAVGYIDGDILFWKTSDVASTKVHQAGKSYNNVVKLQLSSAEKRLPVIVLQWSANNKPKNDGDGKLFIYGGDEIGSDEVLTVLSLDWSTGLETLRCVGRADLQLTGSFADMILVPSAGATFSNHNAAPLVLTSPGRLSYFDHGSLSALASQQERKVSISFVEYPVVIPSVDPIMTVTKLILLPTGENSSTILLERATHMKRGSTLNLAEATNWPMTGGVANQLSFDGDNRVERIYVAGYEDGSVRIWDATFPVLSLFCVLEGGVKGIEVAGSSASVSKLDFSSQTLDLAVGNKCGLVRLYNIGGSVNETSFHLVTESKCEAHNLPQGKGLVCRAVFSLLTSPVHALLFGSKGSKLAVGYECGRVAVLDMSSLSVSFLTNCLSDPNSPIITMAWKAPMQTDDHIRSPKGAEIKVPNYPAEESIFVLTKDAKIYAIHGGSGSVVSSQPMHLKESTVISMCIIGHSIRDDAACNEPSQEITSSGIDHSNPETHSGKNLKESVVLICCKDALLLYSAISVVQGDSKPFYRVKLAKSCCWATTVKKCERISGIVLLYQTGEMEVRSLPDLELVKETSLMSILRWNYKANMEKTLSSTDNGQIALANGREVAFISLLTSENNFRIPESLPCLHDKVLAAAADAAFSYSVDHKKKQGTGPGIIGGIIKGYKGGKVNNTIDLAPHSRSNIIQLEAIFSRNPFPDPIATTTEDQEAVELTIDDVEIDEPLSAPATSHKVPKSDRDKGSEREKLLNGGSVDAKPRLRTREEIIATYRKAGDASSVAGQARNKLIERQEKLERISKRTEELQSGAEDFASLANELVKAMEGRKWWQI